MASPQPNRAVLAQLRAQIRVLEGGSPVRQQRRTSGLPLLDELVGGLPCPGILELRGHPGGGRIRLALRLVAASLKQHQRVAWVDAPHTLYPPGAQALGVPLQALWVLRPPANRCLWGVEQILRSGCFGLVVAVEPPPTGATGHHWVHACEQGHCTLLHLPALHGTRRGRELPAAVRLFVGRPAQGPAPFELTVLRDQPGGQHVAAAPGATQRWQG